MTKMPDLVALGIWEDYDENQHLTSEMSTEYIINCLGAIRRDWPWRAIYVDRLVLQLMLRMVPNPTRSTTQ